MADASALAGLLGRSSNVCRLAGELGRTFQQDFQGKAAAASGSGQSPRQRHAAKIDEFIAAVQTLRDAVKDPPAGFEAVAEQLRKAGHLAKRLSKTKDADVLELFPELNTVAEHGREAVMAVHGATRSDDPFEFLDDTPISATDATTGENLLERLLTGPDNVEMRPREMALLEAYLGRRRALAEMKNEARPDSQACKDRAKLTLIRDFNRHLQASSRVTARLPSSDASDDTPTAKIGTDAKPKRRGRKNADYETQQREAELAADWERARDAGNYKPDFARDNKMTVKQLDALLDRVGKRKARSDK